MYMWVGKLSFPSANALWKPRLREEEGKKDLESREAAIPVLKGTRDAAIKADDDTTLRVSKSRKKAKLALSW